MPKIFNIYCDESCHLENDHQPVMVLGGISCPLELTGTVFKDLREIKIRHGLKPFFEIKWTKVSPSKLLFYMDIIDYFFCNNDLTFRTLIALNKSELNHKIFNQTHNIWYYKMYFTMLKAILDPHEKYRIYLDIKDTCGGEKIHKLHEILSNNLYDFSREIIEKIQLVRSEEIEILQICDLLTGAVSYVHRELNTSQAKLGLINKIREKSGYLLTKSTLLREKKFNLFIWNPNFNGGLE